jgi:hypothetical protein
MVSYHNFQRLIHQLLLEPICLISTGFDPHYSTQFNDFKILLNNLGNNINGNCVWWSEEPFDVDSFTKIQDFYHAHFSGPHCYTHMKNFNAGMSENPYDVHFIVVANSEICKIKKQTLKSQYLYDWYFFFHGFASLDWFRDYKYLDFQNIEITKVFICTNHLLSDKRNYRLTLLASIYEKKLNNFGFISAAKLSQESIKKEIFKENSLLSLESKKNIFTNLWPIAGPIILDNCPDYNLASADVIDPIFACGALFHIVTETIFYEDKLHLTEKIFKPIVVKRPFMLVGSYGSLEYLKSYGFRTFDKWIDESYDKIENHDLRIQKIVGELEKLCQMSKAELIEMFHDMKEVLDYNYNHFYSDFKKVIVDELIENFDKCVRLHNRHRSERFQLPLYQLNYNKVKKVLLN